MKDEKSFSDSIILGIDTSLNNCSVSLACGTILLAEKASSLIKGQSENLFPFIEQVFDESNIELKSLKAIGIGIGPGNFTGLRIGISAAKGLAMALKIKVFGISRFVALVESNEPTLTIVKNIDDTFYTQLFIDQKPCTSPSTNTLTGIMNTKYSPNTIVSGDSAFTVSENLNLKLGMSESIPKVKNISTIALRYLKSGGPAPTPLYIRGPDAKLPKDPVPIILKPNAR
tara:strand:- start:845 stop:1531 length:687 start_codon:yes stop_codon:yes gene_type:complete